jgi:hypothetical protein
MDFCTDLQAFRGPDSFLEDGANLGLGGAPVEGCTDTKGAVGLIGKIANRQTGHDLTSLPIVCIAITSAKTISTNAGDDKCWRS